MWPYLFCDINRDKIQRLWISVSHWATKNKDDTIINVQCFFMIINKFIYVDKHCYWSILCLRVRLMTSLSNLSEILRRWWKNSAHVLLRIYPPAAQKRCVAGVTSPPYLSFGEERGRAKPSEKHQFFTVEWDWLVFSSCYYQTAPSKWLSMIPVSRDLKDFSICGRKRVLFPVFGEQAEEERPFQLPGSPQVGYGCRSLFSCLDTFKFLAFGLQCDSHIQKHGDLV